MRTVSGARVVLLGVLAAGAGMLAACQVRGAQVAQSPILRFFERSSGLICFVAADGNVRLIDQKGGRERPLTADAGQDTGSTIVYAAPTWSPDGRLLAFARYAVAADRTLSDASLLTAGVDGSGAARVVSGKRLHPFYLSWSPDSRKVSLLSQVEGENALELGVATAGKEGEYHTLDKGSPYYWDWRGDGSAVVVHVNIGQGGGDAGERLSILTVDPLPARRDIKVDSGLFQAPNVSPDGSSVAYVVTTPQGFTLHVRELDGVGERTVASGVGGAYFAFSPGGTHIAYLSAISSQPVPAGKITVVDLKGHAAPRTVPDEPVFAFYWAPDGRALAFLAPDSSGAVDPMFFSGGGSVVLRLMGCDPATGRTWLIARFPASRGFLSVIPFFDQYQRSSTIWSPDSHFIVFTALAADGNSGLFVARSDGDLKPRFIASGDEAFWSRK
jgi:Tol biopolymer transport system component